jgi:D-3-phosphoglycerate dehydrogenase
MKKYSFPKDKIKIYLFEKIHPEARLTFEEAGYSVTTVPDSRQGEALDEILENAHVIGVRSRSKVLEENLAKAKRLLAIGCFTVGTDQVELDAARAHGVPVFNAPHSSTRSVAELAISSLIGLSRRLGEVNSRMHQGEWNKSASGSYEIRGKTLGVVGYGHIGQQVGLLGEAVGLNVVFYDVVKKLPLGRATQIESLEKLLATCEFVSLHVPGTEETRGMMSQERISQMKDGAYLLNLSRGNVVDIDALSEALKSKKLAGAAIDVFPSEPQSNQEAFESPLCGLENVLLTPHIGGSTEEAQRNIGREVADSLIRFLDNGSTQGAVKFPVVHLPAFPSSHRILNVHFNRPGALMDVNALITKIGANINSQYLSTFEDVGYLIMDIDKELAEELHHEIANLPNSIKTRILF